MEVLISMLSERTERLQVVFRSDIKPEVMKAFIDGYICENADNKPYKYTDDLEKMYPDFEKWFKNKVQAGFYSKIPERELVLLMVPDSGIVAGFAILKKTKNEKKICTFRISEGWRNEGAGQKLMEACFQYLGTRKPLITISDKCKKSFKSIIQRFDFELIDEQKSLYVEGVTEYIYNGKL